MILDTELLSLSLDPPFPDQARDMVLPLAGKDRATLMAIKRELCRQFLDAVAAA